MSIPAHLSAAAVNLVVGFLVPLLLQSVGGDAEAARRLALDLLADHQPDTLTELRLAGEQIGYSVQGSAMLARSCEAGLSSEDVEKALTLSTRLRRMSEQAQRRLDTL